MKQVYFCKLQLSVMGCDSNVLVKANTLADAENWAWDQALENAEDYGYYYDSDAATAIDEDGEESDVYSFVELYDPEIHDSELNQWALENISEI